MTFSQSLIPLLPMTFSQSLDMVLIAFYPHSLAKGQKKEATKVAATPKSKARIPAKDHPWRRGFSPKVASAKPTIQTDVVVG